MWTGKLNVKLGMHNVSLPWYTPVGMTFIFIILITLTFIMLT